MSFPTAASKKSAWLPSSQTNNEPVAKGVSRAAAWLAVAAALLLHFCLIWLLFENSVLITAPPRVMSVTLVRLPIPVLAKPIHIPVPVPVPVTVPIRTKPVHVPVPIVLPPPVRHATVQSRLPPRIVAKRLLRAVPRSSAPVMHFSGDNTNSGLGLNFAAPASGSGTGSVGAFDDAVKQRIEAAKTYPPALKGMWNECVVSYRVTVDHTVNLLSYKLYGCGNPFLDSAARAAILTANPFPVPPDFGGSAYNVYGSLIFKQE